MDVVLAEEFGQRSIILEGDNDPLACGAGRRPRFSAA
jgi:hypothetical protein